MPKLLNTNTITNINTNIKTSKKNKKVVVFDLDETLGSFVELGSFCTLLDDYFNNSNKAYSIFNELLDLYPEFLRPYITNVLKFLLQKKKDNLCKSVMIYTNNSGERAWVEHIARYFETKLKSKIFEQIISAFKINGKIFEINRTTHDKTVDDFFRCTKLPRDVEICFVDDLFHPKMEDDSVYYIHVRGYKHYIPSADLVDRFINSPLSKDIKNKDDFRKFMISNLKYNITEKSKEEQEMDVIVSKKMLEHMKEFFDKDANDIDDHHHKDIINKQNLKLHIKPKSFKKNKLLKNPKNKTVKNRY